MFLQDGDVVFVRPALRVSRTGEVIRPAIYELRPEETLGDAIRMAGGLRHCVCRARPYRAGRALR